MEDLIAIAPSSITQEDNAINSVIGPDAIAWGGSFTIATTSTPVGQIPNSNVKLSPGELTLPYVKNLDKQVTDTKGKVITESRELGFRTYPLLLRDLKYIYLRGAGSKNDEQVFKLIESRIIYEPISGTYPKSSTGFQIVGLVVSENDVVSYIVLGQGANFFVVNTTTLQTNFNSVKPAVNPSTSTNSKDIGPNVADSKIDPKNTRGSANPGGTNKEVFGPPLPPTSGTGNIATKSPDKKADSTQVNFSPSFDVKDSFYRIVYNDAKGDLKAFVFTFLPARETKMGNWNVPEARTGVPIQTKMRHKMQVIPGAGPIVQTIGIGGTTITLVGALLGNEVIGEEFLGKRPTNVPFYQAGQYEGVYPGSLPRGAYDKAQELTNRLVYPGRPVTIEIKPTNNQATFQMGANNNNIADFIRLTGVITAVRFQQAHADRCYYAVDLFVTNYPEQTIAGSSAGAPQGSEGVTSNANLQTTTAGNGEDTYKKLTETPNKEGGIPTVPDSQVAANFISGQPAVAPLNTAVAAVFNNNIQSVETLARNGDAVNAILNLNALSVSPERKTLLLKGLIAEADLPVSAQNQLQLAIDRGWA